MDDMHAKLYGLQKTAEHQMVSPSQNSLFNKNVLYTLTTGYCNIKCVAIINIKYDWCERYSNRSG